MEAAVKAEAVIDAVNLAHVNVVAEAEAIVAKAEEAEAVSVIFLANAVKTKEAEILVTDAKVAEVAIDADAIRK